jgi:D-alanyl-D-alanine carboxypeptidase (penicillin-binding protein 5/6)
MISTRNELVVAVVHGGVIAHILAHASGARPFAFNGADNGSISHVVLVDDRVVVRRKSFRYNNIDQPNRNRLLWRDRTVDGVKTRHTKEAAYRLIASALRDGMRLISVVTGTNSDEARTRENAKLLSFGYRFYETRKLYDPGVALRTDEVWYGKDDEVQFGVAAPVYVTIPRGRYADLKTEMDLAPVVKAPFAAGDSFGELRVSLDVKPLVRPPMTTLSAVEEAGWLKRLWQHIYMFFRELAS